MYLSEFKSDIEELLAISVPNIAIILSYNDFASIVRSVEFSRYPERQQKTSAQLSVTSAGLDLSVLTDCKDYDIGFEVYVTYDGTLRTEQKMSRGYLGETSSGFYYVHEGKLFLTGGSETKNVFIVYRTQFTKVARGADLSATSFEFAQDLEPAYRSMLMEYFYKGTYEPQSEANARAMALSLVQSYFSQAQWS